MNSSRVYSQRNTTGNLLLSLILAIFLAGCGGNTVEVDYTPVFSQTGIIAFAENSKVAQPIELFIYYPDDTLSKINWRQTAGSDVVFHAGSSKGIAFTPTAAGEYSFQVSFTRNGVSETLTHSLVVTDEINHISARLGHAALEGSDVSLSANLESSALSPDSILWQQVSGPTVTFSEATDGKTVVFFKAPAVSADTLLEFTVGASDGATRYIDTIAILVENAPQIENDDNTAYESRLARVFPFNSDSPYANVLVDCVYSNSITFSNTCRLNDLPLIAQDTLRPTVDDIMDRVVVSHRWMGQRFKAFLEHSDPHDDFKNLLRATTAIVISYDIRPAYYWAVTGAIHLDPEYLWLTPDERDTINQAPDYRASFGDSLNFVMPWRYVKDNNYASFYYPKEHRVVRDASEIVYNLAWLMYHELAHANDFFSQSTWSALNRNDRILDAVNKIIQSTGIQSDKLSTTLPLNGTEMYRLAQIRYHGETATTLEKNYSPSDVTAFFSPEYAPHFYNYSSKREDYAMLFDAFMMKARYDIDRDIAITNQPQNPEAPYIVTWGQRGRIGDANIKPRVDYVTRRILPEFTQATNLINDLAAPIAMESGKTWAENIDISPIINQTKMTSLTNPPSDNSHPYRLNVEGTMFYEKPIPISK